MTDQALHFTEAHNAGQCGVDFIDAAGHLAVVSCGADGVIAVRSSSDLDKSVKIVRSNPTTALHCLATSPKGDQFAVGDQQHFVKIYTYPEAEFEAVATRFTLPVRAVAYSPSGTTLAAGGDSGEVKLIASADNAVFRTLKCEGYIRSLAYDPEGQFLASIAGDGHLQVWDITRGKCEFSQRKTAPKVDVMSAARSGAAWHPDGSLLAVPGTDNDVVCFERLSWDAAFAFKGEHTAPVNLVSFSPNGLYAVTGGRDKRLVVWDVPQKRALERRACDAVPCHAAWHPSGNALAISSEMGSLAMWHQVLPDTLPGPAEDVEQLERALNADDAAPRTSKDEPAGESHMDASHEQSAGGGDSLDADSGGGGEGGAEGAARPAAGSGRATAHPTAARSYRESALPLYGQPQPPFQPGSTPAGGEGRRHFLAYNRLGCISSRREEGFCVVEVAFHDVSRHRKRIPHLNDFYGFTIACLGEKGALYGSPASSEAPSMLVYRPHDAWAANSDWSAPLPAGEEVLCCAAGRTFCAAATSARLLRIFSQAGLQSAIVALQGAPLAMAAQGHQLALVWHAAPPSPAGDQCLQYAVYDVSALQEVQGGRLPLSTAAHLTWLGFTEAGLLGAADSDGVVRVRSPDLGGAWVPLFSAAAARQGSESFWVVDVTETDLHCIVCNGAHAVPQVAPRPVLSVMKLRPPVLDTDAASAQLEADFLRNAVAVSAAAAAAGEARSEDAAAALEEEALARATDQDRTLLKLFQAALKHERLLRALELVGQMHHPRCLDGALKLANHHRMGALSERIALLIQERAQLEADAVEAAFQPPALAAATPTREALFSPGFRLGQQGSPALDLPPKPSPAPTSNMFARKPAAAEGKQEGETTMPMEDVTNEPSPAKRKTSVGGSNPFARKAKAAKA